MSERANPRGWEDMDGLPQRLPSRDLLIELQNPSSLLLIQEGRVLLLRVVPAPNGEYELQRSGKVVVRNGQVHEVLGLPEAPATAIPTP
jgi:hypothetical protein